MKIQTTAEQLLFATLRIETESQLGTGCIVTHSWASDKQGPFLITNKHVVQGSVSGRLTFTLREEHDWAPVLGKSMSISLTGEFWNWVSHPSTDVDIAALPLAGVLEYLRQEHSHTYYRSILTTMIPEQDLLEDLDAVEEVLFVGYPRGIFDRANNLPIFRKGITATPLSVDYENKPTFLIDASVFQGSSGSPVFIYNKQSWPVRGERKPRNQRTFFLGILGSVYDYEVAGSLNFEEAPASVKPVVKTRQMIDLGVVYKARTVVEAIEHLLRQHGILPAGEGTPSQA